MDRFSVFERWLITNGAKFPDLELRTYDTPELSLSSTTSEPSKESKVPDPPPTQPSSSDSLPVAVADKGGGEEGTNEYDEDKEMRGVHAKTDIKAGNTCMVVPRSCLITVEMGRSTPIGQTISLANLDLDAPKHVYLMVFLLVDRKNPDSFFKPYYDILPPKLSNMPIFWNQEELGMLSGSYLLSQISERRQAIVTDYEMICAVAPEIKEYATMEEFMWARMCVCSRNFGLVINGVRTSALVPHADMLNHYRPRETKWTYDNNLQAFTITTLQGIRGGEQIFDSYGQKCNHRFLLNYGFAVERNVEQDGFCPNEVPVVVALEELRVGGGGGGENGEEGEDGRHLEDDQGEDTGEAVKRADGEAREWDMAREKIELWTRDGSSLSKRIRVCVSNNDNTKSMLSLLRVKAATKEDLKAIVVGGPYMYRSAKDIRFGLSVGNEIKAMEGLRDMCLELLRAYPATLEEDLRALEGGGLRQYSNERHARIQVKGEKVVLRHYIEFASKGMEGLKCGTWEDEKFEDIVRGCEDRCIKQYVQEVVGGIRKEEKRRERRDKD